MISEIYHILEKGEVKKETKPKQQNKNKVTTTTTPTHHQKTHTHTKTQNKQTKPPWIWHFLKQTLRNQFHHMQASFFFFF